MDAKKTTEKSFLLRMNVIYLLCIALHIFYAVFGFLSKNNIIIAYNISTIILYGYVIHLNKKDHSFLAAVLSLIDVITYTIIMFLMFGPSIMFQTILLSVIAMTFTLDSRVPYKIKIFAAMLTCLIYIVIQSDFLAINPFYMLSEKQVQMLKITNAFISILPIFYIMTVYDAFRFKLISEEKHTRELLSSIQNLVSETNTKSSLIEDSVESISISIDKSNNSINNIECKSQNVLSSQQENYSGVEKVVIESNKLNDELKILGERAYEISNEGSKATDFVEKGFSKMTEVNSNVEVLKINTDEIQKLIKELLQATLLIKNTSNSISKIAQSTNMLSLNASIESSRSGSTNNGFSVIASEIRNLAEESKNSSNEIIDITDDIISRIKKISTSVETNSNIIENVSTIVYETNIDFDNISSSMKSIDNQVKAINSLSESEILSINNLVQISKSLNSTIEKTLFICSDIANEISSQVVIDENIKEHILKLSKLCSELKDIVNKNS